MAYHDGFAVVGCFSPFSPFSHVLCSLTCSWAIADQSMDHEPPLGLHCAGRLGVGLAGPAFGLVLAPARRLWRWTGGFSPKAGFMFAGPVPSVRFEPRGLLFDHSLADVLNTVREFCPGGTDLGQTFLFWFHLSLFCVYWHVLSCNRVALASFHTRDDTQSLPS